MSDLERTTAQQSSQQNIHIRGASKQAMGKLRSLARQGGISANLPGVAEKSSPLSIDAFAEIFAIMARSDAAAESHLRDSTSSHEQDATPAGESLSSENDIDDEPNEDRSSQDSVKETVEAGFEIDQVIVQNSVSLETPQALQSTPSVEVEKENSLEGPLEVVAQEESATTTETPQIAAVSQAIVSRESESQAQHQARKKHVDSSVPQPIDGKPNPNTLATREDPPQSDSFVAIASDLGNSTDSSTSEATSEGAGIFGGGSKEKHSHRDFRQHHQGNRDAPEANHSSSGSPSIAKAENRSGEAMDLEINALPKPEATLSRTPTASPAGASVASAIAAANRASSAASGAGATSSQGATQGVSGTSGQIGGLERLSPEAAHQAGRSRSTDPKSKPEASRNAETLQRIKLIQRVSKAFQHFGSEGGVIRLRLAPAELGSIRLEMRIQQKKVNARVIAETESAETSLRQHLGDLRGRLEALGMQVESLEISRESSGSDSGKQDPNLAEQFAEHRQHNGGRDTHSRPNARRETQPTADPPIDQTPKALPMGSLEDVLAAGVDLHV